MALLFGPASGPGRRLSRVTVTAVEVLSFVGFERNSARRGLVGLRTVGAGGEGVGGALGVVARRSCVGR